MTGTATSLIDHGQNWRAGQQGTGLADDQLGIELQEPDGADLVAGLDATRRLTAEGDELPV